MRGATQWQDGGVICVKFQLTRPMRGATARQAIAARMYADFNSHAPCGARPDSTSQSPSGSHFNSHAPCGARRERERRGDADLHFNSHAPCGARLCAFRYVLHEQVISTHPPHAGRDSALCGAPCPPPAFQLTRPMRGATGTDGGTGQVRRNFNSHAPCGARHVHARARDPGGNFNSHAPCGARHDW